MRSRASGRPTASRRSAADLVVEAIPEDLALKRDAFRRLDATAADGASWPRTRARCRWPRSDRSRRPDRVVGMHFFNPVPLMALVEVIAGPATSAEVTDAVALLARRLGKTPVVVADTPGFIVNRVASRTTSRRSASSARAGRDRDRRRRDARHRFPMGPFELIDAIGADVNSRSARRSSSSSSGIHGRPHPLQRALVEVRARAQAERRLLRLLDRGRARCAVVGAEPSAEWSAATELDAQVEARILAAIVNEAASAIADGVRPRMRSTPRCGRHELAGRAAGVGGTDRPGIGRPHP